MTMKMKSIGYWAATGVSALALLVGGVADIASPPSLAAGLAHLGYPPYLSAILGTWKLLGAVALLAPGFPRLKEWAYAGILFDLSGAALSHGLSGDGAAKIMTPLVLLAIAAASWALRPEGRMLVSPISARAGREAARLAVTTKDHPEARAA
jgi:uncharacterized membrane protein YphA (DoxX/SURF4 family)